MARPNDAAAIGRHVQGLREAKAAFQALPQIVRDAMLEGTEVTLREIQRGAQARLLASPSIQTRTLYDHVKWTLNKKSGIGKVGIASGSTTVTEQANFAKGVIGGRRVKFKGVIRTTATGRSVLKKPSRYAHLVEFGTRHMKKEAFMGPAADAERAHHLKRRADAGKVIEKNMAAIGMRTL